MDDHLGSPATITDASHAIVERDSFDAWGKRRNADASDDPGCTIGSVASRGFTGHEMIDPLCLINMNARLYDPALGLFLSADTMVPNPFDRTSYNRYAYVNDNPFSFIDPSGHAVDDNPAEKQKIICVSGVCYSSSPPDGMPCWDCYGPGLWNNSLGLPAPVGHEGWGEWDVTSGYNEIDPTGTYWCCHYQWVSYAQPLTQTLAAYNSGEGLQGINSTEGEGVARSDAAQVADKNAIGQCPKSGHKIGSWSVAAGDGEAVSVNGDQNGFSALYGVGAGGSGKIDFSLGGNITSSGSQPAYIGPGTQFSAEIGLLLGVSMTWTQTPTGHTVSFDWNVPTIGLSAFAGVGVVSQMCSASGE